MTRFEEERPIVPDNKEAELHQPEFDFSTATTPGIGADLAALRKEQQPGADVLAMHNAALGEGLSHAALAVTTQNLERTGGARELSFHSEVARNDMVRDIMAAIAPEAGPGGVGGAAGLDPDAAATKSIGQALRDLYDRCAAKFVGLWVQAANLAAFNRNAADQAGFLAEQAALNVQAFKHGQRQQILNAHYSRLTGAAQYEALMAIYGLSRNESMSKAGLATVAGVLLGQFGPIPKVGVERLDGFAGSGQGGASARNAFNYTNPKNSRGLFGQLAAFGDRINMCAGPDSIYEQSHQFGLDFNQLAALGVDLPDWLPAAALRSTSGAELRAQHRKAGKFAYSHMSTIGSSS